MSETFPFEHMLDLMPVPVFVKNADLRYIACNPAFVSYLGKSSKADVIGKTVYDVASPEIARKYDEMDIALLQQGEVQVYDGRVLRADGTLADVEFHKALVKNADGSLAGIVGTMIDISDRRRLENEHRNTLALERLAAVGRVVGGMTQEMNGPVEQALEQIERLRTELAGSAGADALQSLDAIHRTLAGLYQRVGNIRSYTRRSKLAPEQCRVHDLLQEVTDTLLEARSLPQLEIRLDLCARSSKVLCDRMLLRQVLTLVLQNAFEALEDSAVRALTVKTSDAAVGLRLSVHDTGPGIPAALQSQLGQPFVTTKREHAGLGLFFVNSVVRSLGGAMRIESQPENGTRLELLLPTVG